MRQITFSKLLIAFLMMLCCGTAMASDFVTVGGFKLLVDTDKDEATLLANDYSGEVVVPENVIFEGKEYPVTTLSSNCFGVNVTSVKISNTVVTLGDKCFYKSGIENVKLPNSVTKIGNECFSNSKLQEIEIPQSVTSLGSDCFYNCYSLKNIVLPNSLKYIPENCFWYCGSLEKIVVPSSVTSLGKDVFFCCTNLKEVILQEGLTYLGSQMCFYGCSSSL